MNRRGFLGSILALGAAPAVVRASSLMPVRPLEIIECQVGWFEGVRLIDSRVPSTPMMRLFSSAGIGELFVPLAADPAELGAVRVRGSATTGHRVEIDRFELVIPGLGTVASGDAGELWPRRYPGPVVTLHAGDTLHIDKLRMELT